MAKSPASVSSCSQQSNFKSTNQSHSQRSTNRQLLGQKPSIFADLFDKLDKDSDGVLNALELRGLFSYLFGDGVSNEHLQHFENRYLMLYGDSGGLRKDKFLDILKDFDKAHGYNVEEDTKEFYQHFVTDAEPRISPTNLCNGIAETLPDEMKQKISYFKERLTRTVKIGSDLNYENFHLVVCALFKTYNFVFDQYQVVSPTVKQTSAIAHPFYRKKLQEKVALYNGHRDREKVKTAMHYLMIDLNGKRPMIY